MKVLAATLVGTMLLSGPVSAQDDTYDLGVRPAGDECLREEAASPVDLTDLLKDPAAFKGRCVTVNGYAFSRALFHNKADLSVKYAASSPKTAERRLGLYGRDDVMQSLHQLPKGHYVRLTGKVWDCDSMQTSHTVMIMGYCHYTSGPILSVVAYEDMRAPQ